MTRDDIIRMAREAGWQYADGDDGYKPLWRFAELVASAEREKIAQWMMQRGYATGHGDTTEDLLQELDWQIAENWTRAMVNGAAAKREAMIADGWRHCAQNQRTTQFCGQLETAVAAEREECAKLCEKHYDKKRVDFTRDPYITTLQCAAAIRARGNND